MLATTGMIAVNAEEITQLLGGYLERYKSCYENRSQEKYFRIFQRGLLVNWIDKA